MRQQNHAQRTNIAMDEATKPQAAKRVWHLLPHDRAALERLAREVPTSPVVAQLLLNRGVREVEAARRFLTMPFKGLHDPQLLPGAAAAADRLLDAIHQGRRVCVYGDYDVDGLTGTAILSECLRHLEAKVEYYVPHRMDEGYGLNADALKRLAESGVSTVVTVDCGIASVAEADLARQLGLELIITDHHEPKEQLPAADVIVHPRLNPASGGRESTGAELHLGTDVPRSPEMYPFGELSGSGVAFKVAWALCQRASGDTRVTPRFRDFLLESVTLAALGMIADVVPLFDENRIFVRHGLARLRQTTSVGLKALIEACGLQERANILAENVAYGLAPRLNAAGRLGCARLVVELLTTTSPIRANELAKFLNNQNLQRQTIERRILAQARERLDGVDLDAAPAIVLADPEWHAGVIGIVAGRLAEQYARPALLISLTKEGGIGQGSGRSVADFPLHLALRECSTGLLSHGGHAAAAGFKIYASEIDAFRERFIAHAAEYFREKPVTPKLKLDAELPLSAVTPGLIEAIDRLEPYGAGNPRPLFLAGPVQVVGEPRRIGNGERHLRFRIRQEGTTLPVIAFNFGDRAQELMSAEGWCFVAFSPSFNEWQGFRSVQLEVRDFRPGKEMRLG
jgi:single-stranded-DNA-specific exonuclease